MYTLRCSCITHSVVISFDIIRPFTSQSGRVEGFKEISFERSFVPPHPYPKDQGRGCDRPSYLLWPRRGSDGHFWLMEPKTGDYFDPAKANFIAPLGVEHFFDAFRKGIFVKMLLLRWHLIVRIYKPILW